MNILHLSLFAVSVALGAGDGGKVEFARDIQPIFDKSCVKCHGLDPDKPEKKAAAELRLESLELAMKGGESGPAIVPGNAKDSLLFKLLNGPVPRIKKVKRGSKDLPPMPKAKKGHKWKPLAAEQVDLIRRWIDQGAD
jgi:hypothetical protein